ncbi:M20 family metallo-hydrolase [Alicyclobacillus fastidiosus]|uniref:M20 family metallo-hydrolase n=1 Tax=Alicyclobacillus fastidiosus TaxID=392011 RepID=A0ABV5ABD0_9BACL|nr:M20 family metallo-hydrolase [Alicyclobacillus fastidiosus]WEH10454.1 M20 family metallo-hydrolase [Alicyclobacillus fastidiosus]
MIRPSRIGERIESLGKIGESNGEGVTRLALSKEYKDAQALMMSWMEEAGMQVRVDAAGNLIGRKEGSNPDANPVVMGSHIDSVVNGGKYDGTIGVIGGVEVVQHFAEEGIVTSHPIEVIAFCEEEGSRFQSGLFGSQAVIGAIEPGHLDLKDKDGKTRREALLEFGLNPDDIFHEVRRHQGELSVYLEMHIEQGPILEKENHPVGIVTAIAGPTWMEIEIQGKAGHAGTIPMRMRQDALLGASEIALALEQICLDYAGSPIVGTVGRMDVFPGGANVVPGRVLMSVDVRDVDRNRRAFALEKLRVRGHEIAQQRGLEIQFSERLSVAPVACHPEVVSVMVEEGRNMQLECPMMISGAGHDAQLMAAITDVGMVFIRCKDGISHNPKEFAEVGDIALGTELLSRVAYRYAMK